MTLYFITGSKNKLEEAQNIIPELQQIELNLHEIQSNDAEEIIAHKLEEAVAHCFADDALIVEDTSLYFDCLNGLPGPLIKWFMKSIGNEGLWRIADLHKNYSVTARTIIGYKSKEKEIHFFEGEVKGTIVKPTANSGFGWDPIFQPEGHSISMAELSLEEKNNISMRGQSFRKLKEFL